MRSQSTLLLLSALLFASGFVACQPPSSGSEVRKWSKTKAHKAQPGPAPSDKANPTQPKTDGELVDAAAFMVKELDVLAETAHMATSPDAFEKIGERIVKDNGECLSQNPPQAQLGQNFSVVYSNCKTKAGDLTLVWSGESKYTYQPRAASSSVLVDSFIEIKVADKTLCIKRKTDITRAVGVDQTLTVNAQHSSTPGACRLQASRDEAVWSLEFKKLKLDFHPSDQQPTRDGLSHWAAAFETEGSAELHSLGSKETRTTVTLSAGALEFKLCGPQWVPQGSVTLTDGKRTATILSREKGLSEEGSGQSALPFEGCQAL